MITAKYNRWFLIFLLTVPFLLFLSGCPSGYEADSKMGYGYGDERIRHNFYAVHYIGNAFTEFETASDYARLRCAEVCMEHGYKYFYPVDAIKRRQGERIYTPYGPVSNFIPFKGVLVLFFRAEPVHLKEYYEARKTFDELVRKHELMKNDQYVQPKVGSYIPETNDIEFEMRPAYESEPVPVDEVRVIFGVKDFYSEGTRIGRYVDIENPLLSLADFAGYVRPVAAEYGANAVLVEDQWQDIHDNAFYFGQFESELVGFVADLYVLPPVSLGILWEPADLSNGKHIIRKFYDNSKSPEAGLRIGDRVLEINDIDMLDEKGLMELFSQWNAGDIATVDVVRDGQEISIEVPLISNQ